MRSLPAKDSFGKRCSRAKRAGIVDHPIFYLSARGILSDIVGGHDRNARTFLGGDARTIDAGGKLRGNDAVDPGVEISSLLGAGDRLVPDRGR